MTVGANAIGTDTALFDRRARLVIKTVTPLDKARNEETIVDINAPIGDSRPGTLRIRWNYAKSWKWRPNVGDMSVSNLGESTRTKIQGSDVKAQLFAGYGLNQSLVGTLSSKQSNHKHERTDWETKLQGGDGGRAFAYSRLTRSYAGGVAVGDIVTDLVGTTQLTVNAESQAVLNEVLAGKRFANGRSYSAAQSMVELRGILLNYGLHFSVQDEEINVYRMDGYDGFESLAQTFVVGPESGLIGSPEYGPPPHPGKPQLLKVKMLLNPLLRVGCKFELRSKYRNGTFKIWDIKHTGDTYGGDWTTEVQGQVLKNGK